MKKNITDDEYNVCINAWKNNNMKTFKDFLEWYNNLDVLPFIEAIEKMKEFYKMKRLDIFKDNVYFIRQASPQGSDQTVKPRPRGPRLEPYGSPPYPNSQTSRP